MRAPMPRVSASCFFTFPRTLQRGLLRDAFATIGGRVSSSPAVVESSDEEEGADGELEEELDDELEDEPEDELEDASEDELEDELDDELEDELEDELADAPAAFPPRLAGGIANVPRLP
jgi:hypothetical protein